MLVEVNIRRDKGKLKLFVNALELHKLLDAINVPHSNEMYLEGPRTEYSVLSTGRWQLSPNVLLRREYPAEYDLSNVFSTPPTVDQLTRLAKSAKSVAHGILEHYQPVDIRVRIQPKVVK